MPFYEISIAPFRQKYYNNFEFMSSYYNASSYYQQTNIIKSHFNWKSQLQNFQKPTMDSDSPSSKTFDQSL